MKSSFSLFMSVLALFLMTACGGGGGGAPAAGDISVSSSSVTFLANRNGQLPQSQNVSISYSNSNTAAVLVGWPNEQNFVQPSWMSISPSDLTGSSSPLSLRLSVSTTNMSAGTYTTRVRIVTADANGGLLDLKDINVTYIVSDLVPSPTSLSFTHVQGASLPAAQNLQINVGATSGLNWNASVSYGSSQVSGWLSLDKSTGVTPDTIVVTPAMVNTPGTHQATITLTSGSSSVAVPVSYQVRPPMISVATAGPITFSAVAGQAQLPTAQSISLTTEGSLPVGYTASINYLTTETNWLQLGSTAGTAPANISASISRTNLATGLHSADIVIQPTNGSSAPSAVRVTFTITSAIMSIDANNISLSIDSSTSGQSALSQTITASDNGVQLNWTATPDSSWIQLSNASGDTRTSNQTVLSIDASALVAQNGSVFNGNVQFTYTDVVSGNPVNINLPVTVTVSLPQMQHIAPYVGFTGRQSMAVVRGSGFNNVSTADVKVGGLSPASVSIVNDTEMRIMPPVFNTAGRYEVSIDNALNLDVSMAELVVVDVPAYSAQSFTLAELPRHLIHDPERNAVFFTSWSTGTLTRVQYSTGSGWTSTSISIPMALDLALSNDGSELLVTAGGVGASQQDMLHHIDPSTLAINSTVQAETSSPYYDLLGFIGTFNDGDILLFDTNQWTSARSYPALQTRSSPSIHSPQATVSLDRSRMLIGGTNSSTSTYGYDANTRNFTGLTLNSSFFRTQYIGMSSDASRIMDKNQVYDSTYTSLGALNNGGADVWSLAVSPDGTRAYTMPLLSTSVSVWDISGTSGPFPQVGSPIDISISGVSDFTPYKTFISQDGGTLFVLSNTGLYLQIVPIP